MKSVRIHGKVLEEMVEHARREYPLECCGLLSGSGWEIDGIRATGNQRQSREEFAIPVEELFAFFQELRRSGREHLGIYHSHPTSRSLPSSRDVAEFHYPEVSYWIVYLKGREPDVRCFRWDKRVFKNVEFEVYGDHGNRPQECKMKAVQTVPREPDIFANIRDSAPVELLGLLDQIVLLLPEGFRYRLKQVFDSLPPQGDNLQKVLELVRSQWKDIQSQEWIQIAIVGPGQTGRSSLLAALSRQQLAGSKPIFTLVDIHDEYLGFKPDETLSEKLRDVDLILLILDGRYELSKSTKEMYERLNSLNRPVLVVLNKIDLVQTPRDAVRAARRRLGTNVFATSVVQSETIEQLLKAILDTDPKTLSSLTQNFPDFRRSICHGIVSQAALSGAIVGAIRIPITDLLPITAIQTGMLLKIARTFGYPLNRERARELLPMLAAGVAAREGSHWLRRRYPEYRKLISISVAGIWTFVLGHAAIQYFEGWSNFLNDDRSTDFPSPAIGWEIHWMGQGGREELAELAVGRRKGTRSLRIALLITAIFMLVEFVGGLWTNSLALLADAGHMLTDAAALSLSLFAVGFILRPATPEKTYGYFRVEILTALINGSALLVIASFILYEAYQRFLQPEAIKSLEMLVIAAVGLVANLICARILHQCEADSLNIRGAFLHVIGDVLGSLGAILASLVILFWKAYWADAAISVLVSFLILYSAWKLVKDAVLVLLEGTPSHVNLAAMKQALCKVAGVDSIHDLHVWTLTSGVHAMTCHAVVVQENGRRRILEQLISVSREQFKILHATIQIEQEKPCPK